MTEQLQPHQLRVALDKVAQSPLRTDVHHGEVSNENGVYYEHKMTIHLIVEQ